MLQGGSDLKELIEAILEKTGYREELKAEGEIEAQTRLENIDELVSKAVDYWDNQEHPTLDEFLEQVALVADIDQMDDSENRVTLMTLHSAKGLEFPVVYLSGMEDGLFPSSMAIFSDDRADLEEERRLAYVGITRAKERLVLTGARRRMVNGETRFAKVSRFVDEIPPELIEKEQKNTYERRNEQAKPTEPSWKQRQGQLGVSKFGMKSTPAVPAFGKAFTVEKVGSLDYGPGDRVRHIKFGEGTVMSVQDGGRDFEVRVNFDKVGEKKMFASFAKLQKV